MKRLDYSFIRNDKKRYFGTFCEFIKIEIYKSPDNQVELQVQYDKDIVWFSQGQMADLFAQTKQNISLYINNCFKEGELPKDSVVKESLTTAADGREKASLFSKIIGQ